MANAFKIKQVTLNGSGYFTALRGSATTTLVKGIYFSHDDHNTIVTLALTKSGGTTTVLREVTHTADNMTQLLPDTIALESGDQLEVKSTHISSSDVGYMVVNYVENTSAVNGQSIDVLSDVDTSTVAPTTGQALVWDGSQWEPGSVEMDDLIDVNAPTPNNSDVLKWTSVPGRWEPVDWLGVLYAEFKQGTSSTIKNGGGTDSSIVLDSTSAKIKTGITELKLTETSPGDIEFIVATDANGDTAFTALHVDGSTTANQADFLVKNGTSFKLDDGTYTQQLRASSGNTTNTVVVMPGKNGTLATTGDLYSDSEADARIAAASIDDLSDVDTSTVAPTDGQALVWDNTASKWEPGTVSGGGGSSPWTTSGNDIYYDSGNVGIGTTSPSYGLHLNASNGFKLTGGQGSGGEETKWLLNSGSDLEWRTNGTATTTIKAWTSSTSAHAYQRFYPSGGQTWSHGVYRTTNQYRVVDGLDISVDANARIVVDGSSGNVGIGTTTPAATLHVADANGEIHVEDTTNSLTTKMILANQNVIIGTNQSSTLPSNAGHIKIGPNAGAGQTVQPSVAIGSSALRSNSGQYHVAIGSGAMRYGAGSFSAAIGNGANAQGGSYNATIGYQANQSSSNNYNTAIGAQAAKGVSGTSTFANTVAVGYQALTALTTGAGNTAVGYQASKALTTSIETTNVGYQAGLSGSSGASYNTYIGHKAGTNGSSAASNTMVGRMAGTTNSTGDNNVFVGANAALYLLSGGGNVAIGTTAMYANSTGSDNVMIGNQSGRNATGSSNVFIGHDSGYNETGSNKLYIENSNSATPLIYGEFDNDILRVNGTLQVNDPSSTGYAFPTATGTTGQVLEVDANGDLAFATPSGGGGSDTSLSDTDQTLTGDRIITLDGSSLTIEDSSTQNHDAFIVNSDGGVVVGPGGGQGAGFIQIRESSSNGGNYVELSAPDNLTSSPSFTLPSSDGTNGQVLTTNGSGTLSFTTASGGGGTSFPSDILLWKGISSATAYYNTGNTPSWIPWTTLKTYMNVTSDADNNESASDERYVVPATGLYEISGFCGFRNSLSSDATEVKLLLGYERNSSVTGSALLARTTKDIYGQQFDGVNGSTIVSLTAGDTIAPAVYVNRVGSGGNITIVYAESYLHFSIKRLA